MFSTVNREPAPIKSVVLTLTPLEAQTIAHCYHTMNTALVPDCLVDLVSTVYKSMEVKK